MTGEGVVAFLILVLEIASLGFAIWALLSIAFFWIRRALEESGFRNAPKRLLKRARRHNVLSAAISAFLSDASAALEKGHGERGVRVILDERHRRLRTRMERVGRAMTDASRLAQRLAGTGGMASINSDLEALHKETRQVAQLGGTIDEEVTVRYGEAIFAVAIFIILLVLTLGCSAVNGLMMSAFLRETLSGRVMGVPMSALAAWVIIFLEVGCGVLLGASTHFPTTSATTFRIFSILAAAILATIESFIFGNFSNNIDIDLPVVNDHPWMRLWMGPMGVAFVAISCMLGFALHFFGRDLTRHFGEFSLKREVRMANRYVATLPKKWENIGRRADVAKAAIDDYVLALGNQSGALSSAVETIRQEREAFTEALTAANPAQWADVTEAHPEDGRWAWAKNVGAAAATLVVICFFVSGLTVVMLLGLRGALPPLITMAIAALAALGSLVVGWLALDRIQISEGGARPRVAPLRAGWPQAVIVAVLAALLAGGLIWVSVRAFGWPGAFAGLLLIVGAAALAICGYFTERAVRGLFLILTLALALVSAGLRLTASLLLHIGLWSLAFAASALNTLINILAAPANTVARFFGRRSKAAVATNLRPEALP